MVQIVKLNDVQFATFTELKSRTVTTGGGKRDVAGVLTAEVIGEYKQNVIGALLRAGVLKSYFKNLRIVDNVEVELRGPVKHRMPKDSVDMATGQMGVEGGLAMAA